MDEPTRKQPSDAEKPNRVTGENPVKEPVNTPAAWRGQQVAESADFYHLLSSEEVAEVHSALEASRNLAEHELSPQTFQLPTLGLRLHAAQDSLENGIGSFLLRGWPAGALSDDDNQRALVGLSSHLGTTISQSAKGERVFRVEDAAFGSNDPRTRGPNTRNQLSFHCDRCDVIGFLCVRKAKAGGESYLVSTAEIHNEILKQRPDLLAELYQPFYYKTHNVDRANPSPWCHQPVFALVEGHFVGYLLRVLIDRAYELPELPDMTPRQKEALDLVEALAADPNFHYRFLQEPGDIFYVNNFVNLHSRSEFDDHQEASKRRLLLRIWLSVPNSRPLPASFAGSFGSVGAGAIRGGIHPAKTS